MDSKKLKARSEMIRKLAKEKSSDLPGIGEGLKKKKFSKVEVVAKDKKGLEEGLSLAQKLMQAKFGDKVKDEDESEESSEQESDECPICGESLADGHEHSEEESEESDLDSIE